MTKSTPDVSTCAVLNHLQKHSFHLYFSKIFYPGRGAMPPAPIPTPRSGAMLPLITLLALGFLPSYAPVYDIVIEVVSYDKRICITAKDKLKLQETINIELLKLK